MERVGWLESGVPFAVGEVSERFFTQLVELLQKPWEPGPCGGFHRCPFCRFNEVPPRLSFNERQVRMGATNLYVPWDERIFFAPSLIAHYIDAHGYRPPDEFQEAVLACPPMGTARYLKALRSGGMSMEMIRGEIPAGAIIVEAPTKP